MIPAREITGIVLAGGQSSRFGSNKAMAVWNEDTLLQHALDLISPFCGEVFIGGDYPEYAVVKAMTLPDLIPGLGPLGGIYTAMESADTPYFLFLTCDMPLMKATLLKRLLSEEPVREMTVWEQPDGELQLFPLLLSRDLLPLVKRKVRQNALSVRSLLMEVSSRFIPICHGEEPSFLNVNRKEDLEELLKYK